MTDSGGGSKRYDVDRAAEKQVCWGDVGDNEGLGSQVASHPSGWDSSEVSLTNTEKEELTRAIRKVLNFEIVRNEDETPKNGHSVVGLQKENMLEEPEVTSPTKPNMGSSAHDDEGYLDMGYNKDMRPKAKGRWKKLAKEKGPVGDAIMMGQEKGIGFKRVRELEDLEAEEDRKTKRKYGRSSKETAVAAEQHRREP